MTLPPPSTESMVLVTGAASGIGAGLARDLARRGHGLLLVDRHGEQLEAVAAELPSSVPVTTHVCDLTSEAEREALIAAAEADGRTLVGVCNNAGIVSVGHFARMSYDREKAEVAVNAIAVHHLTHAFLPGMVERGSGAILNTASIAANMPVPGLATYSATKAFVLALSEALHTELRGTGVSVSALEPNATRTGIGDDAGIPIAATGIPQRMWRSPDDVAREGVDAMLTGRRVIAPGGPHYRALRPLFRHMPRRALLAMSGYLMRRAG